MAWPGRFLRCLHREFDININWLLSGKEPDLPPRYGFHIKTLITDYAHASASGKMLLMAVSSYLAGQGAGMPAAVPAA